MSAGNSIRAASICRMRRRRRADRRSATDLARRARGGAAPPRPCARVRAPRGRRRAAAMSRDDRAERSWRHRRAAVRRPRPSPSLPRPTPSSARPSTGAACRARRARRRCARGGAAPPASACPRSAANAAADASRRNPDAGRAATMRRLDFEDAEQVRDGLFEKADGRRIVEIADVLRDEGLLAARDADRVLEPAAQREHRRSGTSPA